MSQAPQAVHKRIPSKYFAIIGVALVIVGGLAFLNSLGSGGGYVETTLVISGIVFIIVAIIRSIINVSRH